MRTKRMIKRRTRRMKTRRRKRRRQRITNLFICPVKKVMEAPMMKKRQIKIHDP